MFNSIIFLGRKNCKYSKKIYKFLKKNSKRVFYFESSKNTKKLNLKKKSKFDFLFSFRSYEIISKNILDQIKYYSINFHPGPPNYRGIGCINFAIFKNEKKYGVTAHIMDSLIDHGKILEIKRIQIKKKDNLDTLLNKTHKKLYELSIRVIKKLIKNHGHYKSKKINLKWSKKLWTTKELLKLYELKITDSSDILKRKIRATNHKIHKPYIKIDKFKFKLSED
tara:strand:+ start:61 stop:729 length:669 start_codon:yes stop_codon:yes gene_type:complete